MKGMLGPDNLQADGRVSPVGENGLFNINVFMCMR